MLGNPHRLTSSILEKARVQWSGVFTDLPRPHIALLIGGIAKSGKGLSARNASDLVNQASQLTSKVKGSLLVTTSRRTGPEVTEQLLPYITVPAYVHNWTKEAPNPYLGFLADADYIIVSGDSTSMCAEACATGKPVYIYAPPGMVSSKHKRLHDQLFEAGLAKPLAHELKHWEYKPLRVAETIAERVKMLFAA
jgi:mitochondrial fission protein ELM1